MTRKRKVWRFSAFGDPSVLSLEERDLPLPGPGEIQLRHLAIGVNFIDTYHRRGIYSAPLPLPSGIGIEGIGEITALGEGVKGCALGARIAYVGGPPGAYATYRNLPAARAIPVPEGLGTMDLAAMFLKGLTVEYLIHRCVAVAKGDVALVHAAAGGIGSIACQWLRHMGATVIGTTGTAAKAEMARANGCHHAIVYTQEDFARRVATITGGRGVHVVYDLVGADTFTRSIDCLRARGTLVSFGKSSGPVPPLRLSTLGAKGSLRVTRPSVAHYTADRSEYTAAAKRLFRAMKAGSLRTSLITSYALDEAAHAHADLEARRTTGSVVLLP